MSIVICPGIHDPALTLRFLEGLWCEGGYGASSLLSQAASSSKAGNIVIFPAQDYPAFSAFHILQFLCEGRRVPLESPVVFISFSAGVVGAIGAAWGWQLLGGQVKAFIALDGWGVPLCGNFPIHRLSHDEFTHWSSSLLSSGEDSFCAQPPVSHLDLWQSPQLVQGWRSHPVEGTQGNACGSSGDFLEQAQARVRLSAAQFLTTLLAQYDVLPYCPSQE